MKEAPRIIFLGTPDFAVESLDMLVKHGYSISAVVTAPDQPAGRGRAIQSPPIKKYAQSHGIRVLQPEKLKSPEFLQSLHDINADLFIVVAFRMLPEIVWQMPRFGTFNLHASLLPQYRGAAPINHAIINGETETGLTTFFLKHEIDTGEIIFQERLPIFAEETAGELHDRMMLAGARLVLKTTREIIAGTVKPIGQHELAGNDNPLKPAPKIFRDDCKINWHRPAAEIFNFIRGLSPYPAAFSYFTSPNGESHVVKIYKVSKSASNFGLAPSTLVTDSKTSLSVTAADGILDIRELQLAGKKVMNTEDFLRGFRINSDWKVV
jgi:methionyl-tRNA formyltransferase